jgi:DNA ligase-associated metallophosphoesterase
MILLGDVLHSRRGVSDHLSETITQWRQTECKQEILWIEGNHDRGAKALPKSWEMERIAGPWVEESFSFTHEPEHAAEGQYTLCGHLHPVVRLHSRLDRMRLPCFWFEEKIGILPSFGSFTGGAEVSPSRKGQLLAIAEDQIWDLSHHNSSESSSLSSSGTI